MPWSQTEIRLPAHSRGFHLITHEIESGLSDLEPVEVGLLHVFIEHTSASLTINEKRISRCLARHGDGRQQNGP
jgi:thiamine phosphate synthase YjbQ (UPF0047 family)